MTDTIYLLQLPYLNEEGNPIVVGINKSDVGQLRDNGTHEIISSGPVVVATPIVRAVTHHTFQIGGNAY